MRTYKKTTAPIEPKYRARLRFEAEDDDAAFAKVLHISRLTLARAVAGFPVQAAVREYLIQWCEGGEEPEFKAKLPALPQSFLREEEARKDVILAEEHAQADLETRRRHALKAQARIYGSKP